jgi:hypothetical protein
VQLCERGAAGNLLEEFISTHRVVPLPPLWLWGCP